MDWQCPGSGVGAANLPLAYVCGGVTRRLHLVRWRSTPELRRLTTLQLACRSTDWSLSCMASARQVAVFLFHLRFLCGQSQLSCGWSLKEVPLDAPGTMPHMTWWACCIQNLSGSNIGEDASNVRNNLRSLAVAELDEKEREAGRTEVLPVQWRKHLKLDVRPLCSSAALHVSAQKSDAKRVTPCLVACRQCCNPRTLYHVPQNSQL